jgi:DNA helicase HerA-like ATPase
MEEAHNYLGTKNINRASSIVRRIVKEGRKYGIGAMIVSQRPSEIDPTILSQCGTTISLRLTNSNDKGIVASTVSDNLSGLVNMLPILKTGESIIVGEAVRMPMRTNIFFPPEASRPDSQDPKVAKDAEPKEGWNKVLDVKEDNYPNITKTWRMQKTKIE